MRGPEFKHMRVLRKLRAKQQVELQDPLHQRFLCEVREVKNSFVELVPLQNLTETLLKDPSELQIYVPPLKEKALEFVFQKATELDVSGIYLFESAYSKRLPQGGVLEHKLSRWQKIAKEACKQSGRRLEPDSAYFSSLEQALEHARLRKSFVCLLDPEGDEFNLAEAQAWKNEFSSISLFIGPEGGFHLRELESLGKKLRLPFPHLRAETACIAGASIFQLLYRSS